ncbi:NUDIX domain-containing protein [Streptomyces sp. NPDC088252]|uniref:NUDIX domain-containing protein n=1 Tax=Streptomyces sp. NPDC088252 TaxID=3365845 RepID=UPI0037FFBEFE
MRLPSRKSANPPASPGGAVDKGESPAQGAARELEEELGVTANVTRGLAVDWVSPAGPAAAPALRFPGEILHVFDGGVWDEDQIAAIRPAPGEIEAVEFVEPADLPALMSPGDARRALSAPRARIAGTGPALLEDGLPIAPPSLTGSACCAPPEAVVTSPSTRALSPTVSPSASPGSGPSPRTDVASSSSNPTPVRPACPAALRSSRTTRTPKPR